MEQKLLLAIAIVVVVSGVLIGYNLGIAKAEARETRGLTLADPAVQNNFVVSATYTESLVGYIQSMTKDSITITRAGNALTIPLPKGNTTVVNYIAGKRYAAPLGFPKANDYVNVKTVTDFNTKQHLSTTITVLKRAS